MNQFSQKLYNSIDFKDTYELKLMCKQCSIKGYSSKKKIWMQNKIKTYLKQKEIKEIEKKGLFCYSDIIQIIYQYHNIDDVDLKRKKIIKKSHKKFLKTTKIINYYKNINRRQRQKEIKKYNFHSWYDLIDQNYTFYILSRKDFNKMFKYDLKLWLKTLGYKQKGGLSKLRKKELYNLVIKYNDILSFI